MSNSFWSNNFGLITSSGVTEHASCEKLFHAKRLFVRVHSPAAGSTVGCDVSGATIGVAVTGRGAEDVVFSAGRTMGAAPGAGNLRIGDGKRTGLGGRFWFLGGC